MMNGQWKSSGLAQVDQQVLRHVVGVHADRRLRQLGEPNRQVLVGARVIDAPAAAVAVRRLR